ncbi:MAG: glycosyltransferase family 39 protein [Chloroflexi bacterium]|nr:glycosyltransferase family 39 protein [Chloroflexota bacterium]
MSATPARPRKTLSGRSEIDAATRAFRLALVAPLLVAASVAVLYFLAQPHWLADPDAQDYAQLGRRLATGHGPATSYLPWNGVAYLTARGQSLDGAASWPNIVRFPLTPLLMGGSFLLFGQNDEAVHLPATLAFVLTAGVGALLAARVYGAWAGLVAGLTLAWLPLLVNYSLTGLTEPLLGVLILGVLACVVGRPSERRLVFGGVLLGLAVLNRYDTLLLGAAVGLLWLLPRPDRWRALLCFFGPALVLVLPWASYLSVVAGSPSFNLQPASIAAQASGRADGLGWYLPEYVAPGEPWTRDPARMARLAWEELAATPNHLRKLVGWAWLLAGGMGCLLAAGRAAWNAFGRRAAGAEAGETAARPVGRPAWLDDRLLLAVFLLAAILLRGLLASLLGLNLQRHYVPLVPLLVVLVAGEGDAALRAIAGRLARQGPAATGLLLVPGRALLAAVLILPGLWTILPFLVPPSSPPGPPTRTGEIETRPENLLRLAELVPNDAVVASNVPWSVALYADRRAVPLPPSVDDTAELEARFRLPIDAIYVAGQVSVADAPRSWRTWEDRRRSGLPPPGYVLAESFQNGGRLFVRER